MQVDTRVWDRMAERYARRPISNQTAYARKLAITKERLKQQDTILDIGCGTGSLAIELAPHISHVHAVDASQGMLKIARRKAVAAKMSNITFYQAAAQKLPSFAPGSLDGVLAFSFLHLLPERLTLLAEILKLLKPGGVFISSTVCLKETMIPLAAILTPLHWLGLAPRIEMIHQSELLEEIRGVGFTAVETCEVGAKPIIAFVVAQKKASGPP